MANNFIPGEGLVAGQDFDFEDARLYTLNPADGLYYPPSSSAPAPTSATPFYDSQQALVDANNKDIANKKPTRDEIVEKLTKNIIDQGTMSKWSTGSGLSKEQAARYMAEKLYNDGGITSLKDFGKIPIKQTVPITEQLTVTRQGDDGNSYAMPASQAGIMRGADGKLYHTDTDFDGNRYTTYPLSEREVSSVNSKKGYYVDDGEGGTGFIPIKPEQESQVKNGQLTFDTGQIGYGNKVTGQAIPVNYDRAKQGDWGGTFAGDSSSGYGVQFDAQGNPYFYTHYDTVDPFGGLSPLIGLAAAIFAPELLPSLGAMAAPTVSAVMGLISGQDPTKILTNAALSYAGSQIGSSVSSGLTDTLGSTGANILGNVAKQEIASGGKLDPVQALISGGLSAGTNAVLGQIDGFSDLSPALQKSITAAVSNTLQTGNVDPLKLVSIAIAEAKSAVDQENAINPYFQTGAGTGDLPPVEEPAAPVTVPTQAEQQPAVDDFIKQIEQYQAPEPTVEQIMASEPPPAVAPAAPVEEPTDTVQALLDSQQPAPTNQAEIDQQTQDLLNYLSGGTDNGTSDNGTPANDQAEWDVPVAPSELQTALDNLPQEQAEWDVPVNPDDLNTALTEIAAPEPGDISSPTEQDVLDFMKEHPDDSAGTATGGGGRTPKPAPALKPAPAPAPKPEPANPTTPADKAASSVPVQQYMPSVGDVAHIKYLESLFGPLLGTLPAEPAHEKKDDSLSALEGMDQEYANGGHVDDFDVDALLHILRS